MSNRYDSPTRYPPLAMRYVATALTLLLLTTACAQLPSSNDVATTTTAPTTTTIEASTTTTSASSQSDSPCLGGDRPFSSSGIISAFGGATGDAAQISGLRSASYPECERVVVDLLTTDGAPAGSIGLVGVEYNESIGIVRVRLPETVSRTAVADSRFDGTMVERAFVVRTSEGQLAVDIHIVAGAAVAVRAFEVDAPSRVVVDIRADSDSAPVRGSIADEDLIVVDPGSGPASLPLAVSGYVRTAGTTVTARFSETRESDPLAEVTEAIGGQNETWNEFAISFTDLPEGPLVLFVGTGSLRSEVTGVWQTVDVAKNEPVGAPET